MGRTMPSASVGRILKRDPSGFDLKGKNITFRYPHLSDESDKPEHSSVPSPPKPALDNMSFHFEAGKMHALVGDNGCGKTTLVQLISQLYTNYSGSILLNSHDITETKSDK